MKLPVFRQLVSTVQYLCVRASDPLGRDRARVLAQLSTAAARLQGADCPQKGPDDVYRATQVLALARAALMQQQEAK